MQTSTTAPPMHTLLPELQDLQTDAGNASVPQGCLAVRSSHKDIVPWNHPDNVITLETQLKVKTARAALLQVLFIIGGPANVINMAVFVKQGLNERINMLLFALAVSDEVFLIISMLLYSDMFYSQWTGKPNPSALFEFLMNSQVNGFTGCVFVSWVLTAMMACERCCCVLWPLSYRALMSTRTLAAIIAAVFVVVLGLHFVVVSKYYLVCSYDLGTGVVSKSFGESPFYGRHKDAVNLIDNVFFGLGLALSVVVVVGAATGITAWALRKAVAWRTQKAGTMSSKEVALTKMLIATSLLFLVCVSPACVRRVVSLALPALSPGRGHHNMFFVALFVSQMFDFINASVNIFIYYAMSSRYRDTLWTFVKKKDRQNAVKIGTVTTKVNNPAL